MPQARREDSLRFTGLCYGRSFTIPRRTFKVVPMPHADHFYIVGSIIVGLCLRLKALD
ncbi:MAG: hypothetical protein SAL07_14225 [Oscillatoria sp. PMC 1051.18]|nr:hypothetical protein [Oscillatoria sp. PMC 1050.18]MEC5031050.1 hypothetical protein [Oscillatoria sp. PMC 1051.18]